jgi:hypothetical protein
LGAGRLLSREPDHICCHREDTLTKRQQLRPTV